MELIRKRRDVLIAKAAQLAAAASARAAAQITELPTPPEVRDLQLEAFRREMGMLNELAMPPDFDDYKNGALIGLQGGDALGRCHGCGIGVTGEWMRGPDGPRSLCDSCGVSEVRSTEYGVRKMEYGERRAANGALGCLLSLAAFVPTFPFASSFHCTDKTLARKRQRQPTDTASQSHYARLLEKRNTDEFTLPRNASSWVAMPGTKDPSA